MAVHTGVAVPTGMAVSTGPGGPVENSSGLWTAVDDGGRDGSALGERQRCGDLLRDAEGNDRVTVLTRHEADPASGACPAGRRIAARWQRFDHGGAAGLLGVPGAVSSAPEADRLDWRTRPSAAHSVSRVTTTLDRLVHMPVD